MPATPGPPANGEPLDLRALAQAVRACEGWVHEQARLAREIQQLRASAALLAVEKPDRPRAAQAALDLAARRETQLDPEARTVLSQWPQQHGAVPPLTDHGDILTWWWRAHPPERCTTRPADAQHADASTDPLQPTAEILRRGPTR